MTIGLTGNISQPIGSHASVGVNPITGTAGIGLHTNIGDNIHAGIGVGGGPGGVGVTPTAIVGNSEGNQIGGQIGSTVGGIGGSIGGPIGSAAGSLAGSVVGSVLGGVGGGGKGSAQVDRDKLRTQLQSSGFLDQNGMLLLPDGTRFNLDTDGNGGRHSWTNPDQKTTAHKDVGDLSAYDTDYTNDLDYLASMGGINLSRLVFGAKGTAVDQLGSQIGNGLLGKIGYNGQLTQDNFNLVAKNARAAYAKAGIGNKQDALSLAATAYSQGRINDTDYAAAQQAANIFFDNNFEAATSLMNGRNKGIEYASSSPVQNGTYMQNGHNFAPMISPEEAFASVDPFFAEFRKRFPNYKPSGLQQGANTLGQVAGGIIAAGSAYNAIKNTGIGSGISSIYNSLFGSGGQAPTAALPTDTGPVGGLTDSDFGVDSAPSGGGLTDADFGVDSVPPLAQGDTFAA